jgi:hypothetical protein
MRQFRLAELAGTCLLTSISLYAGPAARAATPIEEIQKLVALDGAAGDVAGFSVAVQGDTAVVGAPVDDGWGAAYVFERDGSGSWSQQAKLVASDPQAGDSFGNAVAIEGERIVVGAQLEDDIRPSSGAAYVFMRAGAAWTQEAKLKAGDPTFGGDNFGASVAIDGETIAVGAGGKPAAYVFVHTSTGWVQQAKLVSSDVVLNDFYGSPVDILGDRLIVGATNHPHAGPSSTQFLGAAYIFARDTSGVWTEEIELHGRPLMAGQSSFPRFGRAVALNGNEALVGAPTDGGGTASFRGAAYLFERSTAGVWSAPTQLVAGDTVINDDFASVVALSGSIVLLGAPRHDAAGLDAGAAYVFERDSSGVWAIGGKIVASDAAAGDLFGVAVSLDGATGLIGAFGDDDLGTEAGAAYAFDIGGCAPPASIDYGGFTSADCAAPQNSVTVFDQTELDAYLDDFGWNGTHVRNLIVRFNPAGNVQIVSPCEVRLAGEDGVLAMEAGRVCVYGRRGVSIAEDQGNPDVGITASEILLVSEEGDAGFSKGLDLLAESIEVVAAKQAFVGLTCNVSAGSVRLVSTGDTPASDAVVKQGTSIVTDSLHLEASRAARLGPSVVVETAGEVTLASTGAATGSVAAIDEGTTVSAGTLTQTSGNKVSVGKNVVVEAEGTVEMDAAGTCSIAASAVVIGDPLIGSCLE